MGICLVLTLACIGVVSADLVYNGGFETPAIENPSGWQLYGDSAPGLDWHVERGVGAPDPWAPQLELQNVNAIQLQPYKGDQYAELDSDYNVIIYQILPVTEGKTYKISFAQACRSDGGENPSTLGVYWGDTYLGQTSCSQTMTWLTHSYSPIAPSGGEVKVMFVDEGTSNSYGVLLDAVEIAEEKDTTPVPEFPTMALPAAFIVGMLGVVLFIQRTKEN